MIMGATRGAVLVSHPPGVLMDSHLTMSPCPGRPGASGHCTGQHHIACRGRALAQSCSHHHGLAIWVNYVREDIQFAGLSVTWWRKSQDGAGWRLAIECLLQRT